MAAEILSPEMLGTGLDKLVSPCPQRLASTRPDHPANGPTIGLTFSGGGFRATLAALGVVRFLADAGLLANLRYVSSVSGGSLTNAVLAKNWPAIREAGYSSAAVDELVIDPLVEPISSRSLESHLIRNSWRAIGSKNRTGVLADAFDDWWLDGVVMDELDPEVRWVINAANMATGVRFGFERDQVGDYVIGRTPTAELGIRLATAASASAAVPGPFTRVTLPNVTFPCEERGRPSLLDGGVYDNTGLEALDSSRYRDVFTISLNAGGVMTVGPSGKVPIVKDLMRANAMLYRQSNTLRTRWMVERFNEYQRAKDEGVEPGPNARQGLLFALASTVRADGSDTFDWFTSRYPEHRTWDGRDLAYVPTVFKKLPAGLCRALVYRGWWLTGATMHLYHADELPGGDLGDGPPVNA